MPYVIPLTVSFHRSTVQLGVVLQPFHCPIIISPQVGKLQSKRQLC